MLTVGRKELRWSVTLLIGFCHLPYTRLAVNSSRNVMALVCAIAASLAFMGTGTWQAYIAGAMTFDNEESRQQFCSSQEDNSGIKIKFKFREFVDLVHSSALPCSCSVCQGHGTIFTVASE